MDKMQTQEIQTREMISALADGQLQGEAFARGVEAAATDPLAREAWAAYHLIGDVLRSGTCAPATSPSVFVSRLQLRLREENLASMERPARAGGIPVIAQARQQAANDGNFRWKVVAGLASVAAVAAIGWSAAGRLDPSPQAQIAAAPASGNVVAGSEGGRMIRDPRIDEFLAAHRQLGGASALPMPAGFLRNATFEGPAR